MKFRTLKMFNWRVFHGSHSVEFSTDPRRPVTLLLGPNGAGKTALLNAFTWAIYGEFTEGFDNESSLVNFEALEADPSAEAWVEIDFEHEGDTFRVRRTTDDSRQRKGDFELVVTQNDVRATEDDVHRILPEALQELFFFPAESFSTASVFRSDPAKASLDVGRAIRSLLSGDVYDHAIADLTTAIDSDALKPPMRDFTDSAVVAAWKAYEQARAEVRKEEERRESLPGLLADAEKELETAKGDAERYNKADVKARIDEGTRLTEKLQTAQSLTERARELYSELANNAHRYLSSEATRAAVEQLDRAEQQGLMPPLIPRKVLEESLKQNACLLCGVPLGEKAVRRVEALRDRAAQDENAVLGLRASERLRSYRHELDAWRDRFETKLAEFASALQVPLPPKRPRIPMVAATVRNCIDVAQRLETSARRELDEFNDGGTDATSSATTDPSAIFAIKQQKVYAIRSEMATIEDSIDVKKRAEHESLAEYKRKSRRSEEHNLKTAARQILQEVKGFFDAAKRGLEEHGRVDFEKAINATYSDLIAKPFRIEVGGDFGITVSEKDRPGEMPLSQSEKVLLLIAFLGAIARLAPHYEEIARERNQWRRTGVVEVSNAKGFPVVLDAPTSPLDEEYEGEVVAKIPDLLPQVIVPVSAKSVAVWETIEPRIGAVYIMELTSASTTDRKIRWRGKDRVYSSHSADIKSARTKLTQISQ
jgi:DNA sulfur modification protein DndD